MLANQQAITSQDQKNKLFLTDVDDQIRLQARSKQNSRTEDAILQLSQQVQFLTLKVTEMQYQQSPQINSKKNNAKPLMPDKVFGHFPNLPPQPGS